MLFHIFHTSSSIYLPESGTILCQVHCWSHETCLAVPRIQRAGSCCVAKANDVACSICCHSVQNLVFNKKIYWLLIVGMTDRIFVLAMVIVVVAVVAMFFVNKFEA